MALLYFKVIGNLIIRNGENEIVKWEKLHPIYNSTMYLLMFFVFAGIVLLPWLLINIFIPVTSYLSNTSIDFSWVGTTLKISNFNFPVLTMALAFLLFPITIIIAMLIRFKSVDRVKEYTCGENINYRFSSFYFSTDKANPYFIVIGGIFFICLIAVGGII